MDSCARSSALSTEGSHRFCMSSRLRSQMEGLRYPGKSAGVRGIVDDNDRLVKNKGFSVPGGGRQELPSPPQTEIVRCPPVAGDMTVPFRFDVTEFCVANVDTVTAAIALGDACALNFANAKTPGGRYRSGGLAQEEDLCRLLPQLCASLEASADGAYPIAPDTALLTRGLLAVRRPGTYELCASLGDCTIITAAMPCGACDRRPKGGWAGSPWAETVTLRIRAVLHAARYSGHSNLVLGAFGCGAFGNPAGPVAAIFREQLASAEHRGAFSRIVFAIIDPMGTGNLRPFVQQLRSLDGIIAEDNQLVAQLSDADVAPSDTEVLNDTLELEEQQVS
eukprot:TRINITY_DN32799_c0_g1_i2.p1 TRINITY_DN32799_c0_g1~~TRINITY_DN32799_c0_g1_i2.p1  ORF type:complete len:336 (-),score=55.29 TRINITY_DN32799_c0_g1_i2:7-1014(-)